MSKSSLDFALTQMQSKVQTQAQTQAQSKSATSDIGWQQLAILPPAQRLALYEQNLQHTPIHISSDGRFSNLEPHLALKWHLTIPMNPKDIFAAEAAEVFYSRNEFAVPIATIPHFVAWQMGNDFRPSDLVTRLAVLYGQPEGPIGSRQSDNRELLPVLSMPRLRSVRLVYPTLDSKCHCLTDYLRPSAWAILELQRKTELRLQMERRNEYDEVVQITDITSYLDPPTAVDEAAWLEAERIIAQYQGPLASYQGILDACGWKHGYSREELCVRLSVRQWAEKQRLEMLASQDVEMTEI
jgi:hypothetical protein